MTIDWAKMELRDQPSASDIADAVKKVQTDPDAGDHGHIQATMPIYGKALPAIPSGSWAKLAKQKTVKLKKLQATNAQLNRANLIWHLQNPGKSRFRGPLNTHPQILKMMNGKRVVVDGHHRLAAEQLLGLKKDAVWQLDEKDL